MGTAVSCPFDTTLPCLALRRRKPGLVCVSLRVQFPRSLTASQREQDQEPTSGHGVPAAARDKDTGVCTPAVCRHTPCTTAITEEARSPPP